MSTRDFAATLEHFERQGIPRLPYLPTGSLIVEWNRAATDPAVNVHTVGPVFTCTRCWALVAVEALTLHDKTHEEAS